MTQFLQATLMIININNLPHNLLFELLKLIDMISFYTKSHQLALIISTSLFAKLNSIINNITFK
jgi:hypothetical protein